MKDAQYASAKNHTATHKCVSLHDSENCDRHTSLVAHAHYANCNATGTFHSAHILKMRTAHC